MRECVCVCGVWVVAVALALWGGVGDGAVAVNYWSSISQCVGEGGNCSVFHDEDQSKGDRENRSPEIILNDFFLSLSLF